MGGVRGRGAHRAGMAAVDCARSVPKRPPWLAMAAAKSAARSSLGARPCRAASHCASWQSCPSCARGGEGEG